MTGPTRYRFSRGRFAVQLAPLVDLLLIIVFAQFLEVRQTSQDERLAMRQQQRQDQQRIDELTVANESIRRSLAEVTTQSQQERQTFRSMIAAIGNRFAIDRETAASPALIGDRADAIADEVARTADRIARSSPEEVLRFLVSHAELLKRAEVWHLHADDQRRIVLATADAAVTIRLERNGQADRTVEFEDALFAAYKQLPQPKGLVVILVSYSPAAVAGVYQPMIDGIAGAARRMRTDQPSTRFEFSILGTTPLPDIMEQQLTQ